MNLLDRLLLRNFFQAWAICFFTLVSLYLVIDLFNKLDEFFAASEGTAVSVFEVIVSYYAYHIVLIFDRLCGVMVMLAAMFTIAWMQRNNELLPLLSAGVPTRRVLRPIFFGALVMLGLSLANREFVMPQVAERLEKPASDPRGEKVTVVHGAYEPNGILISGQGAIVKERMVFGFSCTLPERLAGGLFHVTAREARYVPPGTERLSGGWLLSETTPRRLPSGFRDGVLIDLDPGKLFLRTQRVDFELVTRSQTWYQYASFLELIQELQKTDVERMSALAVQLHLRLTMPILTLIMVWMGVSMILRDQCRNVFLNAGMCLVLAGVFYAALFGARYLGENEYVAPHLAAWLPVLGFGPLAVVLFDAIHT